MAIAREMAVIKHLNDFISGESETVLPRMINNYNRRKQGIEYLQHVLSPVLDKVIALDLKLELNPRQVHRSICVCVCVLQFSLSCLYGYLPDCLLYTW